MGLPPARPFERAGLIAAAVLVLSSCGGGSSPSPGAPSGETPLVPGATVVNGTERLAWNQTGDVAGLQFLAYVDGSPVALDTARCDGAPEAECSAPLPPLTNGVHTIALAAVSASGLEGERSGSITVQKVAARSVVGAASFPDARASSGEAHLEATVTTPDGLAFAVDVVARALKAPLQLAPTPDGRLLVAEADGRVRVIRPGEADRGEAALDARALLEPSPVGPPGLALHPDFARNHFVYLSFLARDGDARTLLRIVRLREVGDALGEAATFFEAPVAVAPEVSRIAADGETPGTAASLADAGPRLAFGPDGLLYALLPRGVEFDNEPAASRPHASMLRLTDEGRVPDGEPLSGIVSHPLGFGWHPATAALWGIVPGRDGEAEVRALATESSASALETGRALLRMNGGLGLASGALTIEQPDAGMLALGRAFAGTLDRRASGTVRLAVPVQAEAMAPGLSGMILDVVSDGAGAIFVAMSDVGAEATAGDRAGVVVRLRPRAY